MSESLPASAHENSQTTVTQGRSRALWLRAAIVLLAGGALIFWQRHRIISPALRAVVTHHVRNHDLKAAAAWAETARRIVPDDPSLAILQAATTHRQPHRVTECQHVVPPGRRTTSPRIHISLPYIVERTRLRLASSGIRSSPAPPTGDSAAAPPTIFGAMKTCASSTS